MYFVDRKKIEATLQYMESCLELFRSVQSWDSDVEHFALERMAHVVIESIVDVGNAMIDGFIMRDPGSYEDIIDILCDETVITQEESDRLKAFIAYRKTLVQAYRQVNHSDLKAAFENNFSAIAAFPAQIHRYLEEELGPVSAFLSHGDEESAR